MKGGWEDLGYLRRGDIFVVVVMVVKEEVKGVDGKCICVKNGMWVSV